MYFYTRLQYIVCSIGSMLVGVCIYLVFRNESLLVFKWFPFLLTIQDYFTAKPTVIENINPFIAYNLPDGLWVLSGIFLIRSLWIKNEKIMRGYLCVFSLFAVIFEVLQLNDNIPGTFDFLDLIVIMLVILLENIIYRKR
ncbi:hypothetical protein AGMMS49991_04170 [Spirochaetia bacterium]|nr:hypothetical protein AGMMS49991_04170 [Spirochaetia bacterium]